MRELAEEEGEDISQGAGEGRRVEVSVEGFVWVGTRGLLLFIHTVFTLTRDDRT